MNMADRRRASVKLNEMHRQFADEDYEQMRADYRRLLQDPAFRRVLVGILKRARVFGSVSMDTSDTNAVMKMIGWRELGVDIYFTANTADGAMVLKAIEERTQVEKDRKQRLDIAARNETKGND